MDSLDKTLWTRSFGSWGNQSNSKRMFPYEAIIMSGQCNGFPFKVLVSCWQPVSSHIRSHSWKLLCFCWFMIWWDKTNSFTHFPSIARLLLIPFIVTWNFFLGWSLTLSIFKMNISYANIWSCWIVFILLFLSKQLPFFDHFIMISAKQALSKVHYHIYCFISGTIMAPLHR